MTKGPRLRWAGNNEAQRQADTAYARLRPKGRKATKRLAKKQRPKPQPFNGNYREYLLSPQWAKKRRKAFAHYGRKCTICGATRDLDIHHRHYKTIFRETVQDLNVLCRGCHNNHHEADKGAVDPMTAEFLSLKL